MSIRCECCGRQMNAHELGPVAGAHVATACAGCRQHLARAARDAERGPASRRARRLAEGVRQQVMAGGWPDRAVVGPMLRWVDRHLPW